MKLLGLLSALVLVKNSGVLGVSPPSGSFLGISIFCSGTPTLEVGGSTQRRTWPARRSSLSFLPGMFRIPHALRWLVVAVGTAPCLSQNNGSLFGSLFGPSWACVAMQAVVAQEKARLVPCYLVMLGSPCDFSSIFSGAVEQTVEDSL